MAEDVPRGTKDDARFILASVVTVAAAILLTWPFAKFALRRRHRDSMSHSSGRKPATWSTTDGRRLS